jgi:hypothetical protein
LTEIAVTRAKHVGVETVRRQQSMVDRSMLSVMYRVILRGGG